MNLLIPIVMIVFGAVFLCCPPEEINSIYGYRTARSMASREAWMFAHHMMGKLWLRLGLVMLPLAVAVMFPCMGKESDAVGLWGGIVCGVECLWMILPVIPTEKALKKNFG